MEKTSDRLKLFCTDANAKRLWLKIRWRLGLWKNAKQACTTRKKAGPDTQCVRGRMRTQWKTSSSSTGLPLKSKSVKTWETEVWRWSFLYNYQRIWLQDDRNKVESKFETYCSTTVRCGHGQIRQCQRCLTSDSCTSNLTQNPNQCGTSLHNGEIAMARHVNVWRWKSCLYIQRC